MVTNEQQPPEPLHVLVLPTWYPNSRRPDYAVYFRVQTRALQRVGAKVGVIFPELREYSDINSLASALENRFTISSEWDDGYPVLRWSGWRLPKLHKVSAIIFEFAAKRLYKHYVKAHGEPDIILAHTAVNAGWAASKIAEDQNLPFVVVEHSTHFSRDLYDPSALARAQIAFDKAQKVFAVSEPFCKLLSQRFSREIAYAPNAIDTAYFTPQSNQDGTPIADSRPLRLAFVGTLDSKKGIDVLLNAVDQLIRQGERIDLRLIGEGSKENAYRTMVNSKGLENSVTFLGHKRQPEVRELMRWADIFVLPSRYETFGVVLIEALATGTPVASTFSGGPESIVTDDDLGVLVPVDDSDALSEAIMTIKRRLPKSAEALQEQAKLIHEKIENRFSANARAKIMLNELQALTKESQHDG